MKRLLSSTLSVLLCVVAALALMARSRTPASRLPFNTEHELRKHRPRQTPVILYHGGPVIVSGTDIKYAVAPDPPSSLYSGCSGNVANYGDTTSPNGDIGMDAVADDLIHEISETVTDPDLSAWYTKNGAENADLCNFVYGATFLAPNGSHANHTFGTRNYLVQEIWDRIGSFCALSH